MQFIIMMVHEKHLRVIHLSSPSTPSRPLKIEIADPSSMTGLAQVICNCVCGDGWCFIYNAGIIIIMLLLTDDGGKKWTVIIIVVRRRSPGYWWRINQKSQVQFWESPVFHLAPVIKCCHWEAFGPTTSEADEKRWSEINGEGCCCSTDSSTTVFPSAHPSWGKQAAMSCGEKITTQARSMFDPIENNLQGYTWQQGDVGVK